MDKVKARLRYFLLVSLICVTFVGTLPASAKAARLSGSPKVVGNIFMDTCIGIGIGILLGTAITATQSDPDWGAGIGAGAAVGGVGGLLFGMIYESKPLFYTENGDIKIQAPSVAVKVRNDNVFLANSSTFYNLDLFRHKF